MLKGFMDHWVPTTRNISTFWKQDLDTATQLLDELRRDIDFDNVTFYTKWYTNGVKSNLPYLHNHPESSNVKTGNEWGRQLIKHLHESGVTVGSMIQFLTYEANVWEADMTIDEWDVRHVAETELPTSIADFTDPRFQQRVKQIVIEQLSEFPEFDYLFLEFEGLKPAACKALYAKWAPQHGYPEAGEVHYDADKLSRCERLGVQEGDRFIWSDEAQAMMSHYYKLNLQAVKEAIDEVGFRGQVGVVIYVCGYETYIYPSILPDPGWWLVPWVYLPKKTSAVAEQRKQIAMKLMAEWKRDGFKQCYIGDVTIEGNNADIRELYRYCEQLQLDMYLGMGNPTPGIGLKWLSISEADVLEARDLYKQLYNREGS